METICGICGNVIDFQTVFVDPPASPSYVFPGYMCCTYSWSVLMETTVIIGPATDKNDYTLPVPSVAAFLWDHSKKIAMRYG